MNAVRLVSHSAGMMRRHKLRTGFMMIGSFVGVAALTLVVSVGLAAERKLLKLAHQMFGESSLMIIDGGGHMMGGPRNPGKRLKIDDLEAIGKQIREIESWDAQQGLTVSVRHADLSDTAQVLGESERSEHVWGRTPVQGAYFDAAAVRSSERVALIGQTVVNQLFGNENPIGHEIQIGSVPFRVIGILEPWGTDPHGMDRDNEIVVPISTVMHRLTNVDTVTGAKLLMTPSAREDQVVKAIDAILRERHGLAAGQPDDFSILTASQVRQVMDSIKKVLSLYLPMVAAISLLAGGIVSAALMVASVNDRAAEIGLRRAVGARTQDIRLQFLIETSATTLAGGFAGILLGYVLAHMGAAHMHLGSVSPWGAALLGIISSIVVGLAAGLLPAQRAARMSPVDALR